MDTRQAVPRAILVGVQLPSVDDIAHSAGLAELRRLVKTLGYEVVATVSQKRTAIDGSAVLGTGRLAELAAMTGGSGRIESLAVARKSKARERFEAEEAEPTPDEIERVRDAAPQAELVIVDHELSPTQARNLERATGAQVLDRTGVIVEIFHRHARSREARLQVEMARLKYVAPRLRESSVGPGRQQGAGAGESDLELDRRKVRDRLAELKEQLDEIQRNASQRRYARRDQLRVALVGYTNAGEIVAHARPDGERGADRRQAFRDPRHDRAGAASADASADTDLRHRRFHQEASARSRRFVQIDPR